MAWEGAPVSIDEGELYVTTRRIYFSGGRETRDIPLNEIIATRAHDSALEVQRRDRPCPLLFGVPYPRELEAFIRRATSEGIAQLPPAPVQPALSSATLMAPALTSGVSASGLIKCPKCNAANGLSANFCQNCASPISAGSTPTLNYRPGQVG